jgi:VanZ family protein
VLLMPTALFLFLALNESRVVKIASLILVLPIVIEVVQILIPGRDPDLRDFLVNSLGGLTFLYLLSRFTERVRS